MTAPRGLARNVGGNRGIAGLALGAVTLTLATIILVQERASLALASVVLIYLVAVVAVAVVGGVWPALGAALASDVLVNFYFVPPFHTFNVESRDNVITLFVYVVVAVTVSLAVDLAARQRAAAARHGVEAALLARISAEPVREGSVASLLEHVRDTLGMTSAALIEGGTVVAVAGDLPSPDPALRIPAGTGLTLVVDGPSLFAPDQRFLHRLAAAAARTLQAERLATQAAEARQLAEVDRLRAALLAAVGHDLRTPLAGAKAATSSMRDPQLRLTDTQREELLATVDESIDRMAALVENLLAMSRLQAGALSVNARPIALDEVVAAALLHSPDVDMAVPDDLPLAYVDPGLLERVVANLVENACRAGPPVQVTGRSAGDRLELRVIDHGPGVAVADRERIFAPFQRLNDHTADGGLGLGLAIARGFTEAMNGTVAPSDTPGGGLTMTVTVPAAVP